ncbi:hypothetical protein P0L94_01090 [Microbacter sp. GSS18]|nr:hypothetical protein P0L94_01090 [Microbacter sp. GSS18]
MANSAERESPIDLGAPSHAFATAECPTCRVLLASAGYCRHCGEFLLTA